VTDTEPRLSANIVPGLKPFPGALVIASIKAPKYSERPGDAYMTGKVRPAVLRGNTPDGEKWITWGVTTLSERKRDGDERVVADGIELCGLEPINFVWGGPPVLIFDHQILGVVWAAPKDLIYACAAADQCLGEHLAAGVAKDLHQRLVDKGWYWPKPEGFR